MPFDFTNAPALLPVAEPVVENETQALLRKAKEVLQQRGWTQGHFSDGQSYCSLGAVRMARFGNAYETPMVAMDVYYYACDVLDLACGGHIVSYNDKMFRAKDDVLGIFDRAIELAATK